jgi:hypothetical protein
VIPREVLGRLAGETGGTLAELGVRPADRAWIGRHAGTLASLERVERPRRGWRGAVYRLARRAARIAR